ncbi:MAG: hypothetical protein M1819_003323 [Sarea resinae]|nr:MAG: hypothetical protein M1819_003323 [Sarea resinae]
MSVDGPDQRDPVRSSGGEEQPSDERSPLLAASRNKSSDNGTIRPVEPIPDEEAGGQVGQTDEAYEDEADDGNDDDDDNAVPEADELSTRKLALIMSSTWVGVFLAALDATIIATLTAAISNSFDSLSLLSWLASAYFIANAALQPLSGRLTDIFGRRTGLLFSNVFFAAGNLICGLATKEWVMILGRVVAGMGGGGLTAISTFVGSDLVPLRKRGVWQGIGNLCFGLGAGLGGVFGGWINDVWGWRVVFLIQVPLVVVSGLLVFFTVKIPVKEHSTPPLRRVDFLGALSLLVSLVLLLLGLNSGGNQVPWTHPLVLTTLPLAGVSLCVFVYVESRVASEPIIPVHLLLDRTVAAACLTNWFITMSFFAIVFYAPLYFQIIHSLSTTASGARLIPQPCGTALGSLGSGLLMKATGRYYVLNGATQAVHVASTALMATLGPHTPAWPPLIYFFLNGAGYGAMLTVSLLALIAAVPHSQQAVITSASYAFRSTGSTIGITVASAVFQNILPARLWRRFGHDDDDGNNRDAADMIRRLRESLDAIKELPPHWRQGVLDCYMDALRGVFLTAFGLAVLGAVVSLLMREHVLHGNLARK